MDLSQPQTSSNEDEILALNTLLDVFGCACSLDDIADAYIKANGDVNKAGDFLTNRQLSLPRINDVEPSLQTNISQTNMVIEENYMENSSQPRTLSRNEQAVEEKYMKNSDQTRMTQKFPKTSATFGTVSGMLGKESSRATTRASRASKKEKPQKVELPEYMRDDFKESDESDSAPRRETLNNRDVEEFLFCMLGEGFKLSMEVIREVLGSCGYDVKKSVEELMSFSEKHLDKKAESKHNEIQDVTVEYSVSKGRGLGSQSVFSTHPSQDMIQRSKPQISPGELIEAIFTVPERLEEQPKLRRYELGSNQNRVPAKKPVLKPLEAISSIDFPINAIACRTEPTVNEEDYQNYRRAAKRHWDMMKQYYEKAADAFREGKKKEVDYLVQEGKRCYQMARLADEKSAGEIIKSKKTESRNDFCLDLHTQDATNVSNLLKLHMKQLADIPTFDYLKVIIGVDDSSFKMGQRRRKQVMKYLEKNSIQWTEEEPHSGNILVQINQVGNQHG